MYGPDIIVFACVVKMPSFRLLLVLAAASITGATDIPGNDCCEAAHAVCMACNAGETVSEWCEQNRESIQGCKVGGGILSSAFRVFEWVVASTIYALL